MSVIRSAGLRGFATVVRELGGDPSSYAVRARLDPRALVTDDLLVPESAVADVLEIAATGLACPDLGLRVAARQDLGMLGPLALAITNSPTVGDALVCTSRYLFVHAPSLSLSDQPDPYGVRGVSALRYGGPPGLPMPVQGTDLGLGFLHRAIQLLVGGSYGLRTVEMPHAPAARPEVYEAFFGVQVRFRRPEAMLRLPSSLAERPLAGSDESLRRIAVGFLAEQPLLGGETTPRVRAAVQQLIGTGVPELGAVARLLGLHPRTLQRRLAGEGVRFTQLVDEVRRQEAQRYLTTTDIPLAQLAALLGLSEQSALTRCSHRWWGVAPTAVRRRTGHPGSTPVG